MEIPSGHHQAMATHQLEEALACPGKTQQQQQQQQQQQERKIRSHPEQALKCPRCASTNTKFCYYNNYSLSQPRYFCKGCRRYWTQGGSLRNVPVGGGCRKNKRSSTSSSKKTHETNLVATNSNPMLPPALMTAPLSYDPSDLTLTFASLQGQPPATAPKQLGQLESLDGHNHNTLLLDHGSTEPIITPTPTNGFLDILRSSFVDTTGTTGFNGLYYGFGMNGNAAAEVGGGANVGGEEGALSTVAGLAGATSQDSCKDLVEGETKMLMGLPWQVAPGDGNITVESGRDYWTGGVGSSWHGLINSSLM